MMMNSFLPFADSVKPNRPNPFSGSSKYALKFRKIIFLIAYFILNVQSAVIAVSIPATVSARVDTNQIRIGEQIRLELQASTQPGIQVGFPVIPDTLRGFDVVRKNPIDTLRSTDGKNITYRQLLQLTSFDSGFYVLEPFVFTFREKNSSASDSMATEAQLISVRTIAVDTTKEIKDIKPTLDVPFSWKEWISYLLIGIFCLGVIFLIFYYLKKRKKQPEKPVPVVPSRPAHLIAMEALHRIEAEKLWQQGHFKKYHSEVSDTLRAYIEHRYSIQAMELTTDETLDKLQRMIKQTEACEKLRSILQLADLVKFAKSIPVVHENEQSMTDAYSFIALTKQADITDFKSVEEPA